MRKGIGGRVLNFITDELKSMDFSGIYMIPTVQPELKKCINRFLIKQGFSRTIQYRLQKKLMQKQSKN